MKFILIISLISLSLNANNNEKIRDFFIDNDFTNEGTAAILGYLYFQSGLNPAIYDPAKHKRIGLSNEDYVRKTNDGSYKNFVSDKVGFGIALWGDYIKKRELLNLCKGKISDLYCQLNFFLKDLKENPNIYKILKTTHDLNTACDKIFSDFGEYEIDHLFNENRVYCKKFI
jgi:hypothetical protein